MSATFEIKINAIRTTTVNGQANVVKKVEFTVRGTEAGQTFELPQNVDLGDPGETFVPLESLSEANVVSFVEGNFNNMDGVKAHIQAVLDREVAKAALQSTPLPWAPAPEVPAPEAPTA